MANLTDRERLEQAREAYRNMQTAEGELARLRRYTRLTAGMKDDQDRWLTQFTESKHALERILNDN